jgi:quercetin dioxygenase-like cupin family protein
MGRFSRCWAALGLLVGAAISSFAQDSSVQKVFENDRVRISRVVLSKGSALPTDNTLDAVTIQLEDGDTTFYSPLQVAKRDQTKSGQVHYFVAGSQRSIRTDGKKPLAFVQIQFLHAPGKYSASEVQPSHYCDPGSPKACVTEQYLFCTDRFCGESVVLDPGAISNQHTHATDHIVVATSNFEWREEIPGKAGTVQAFKTGQALYVPAGVTHRLVNTGSAPARMFTIQYK